MNPRQPFYPVQHQQQNQSYNRPPPNWSDMRNNRMAWKRNRNWQTNYNREAQQPYSIPPKIRPFNQRFQPNRFDNGGPNFYESNGHQGNWMKPHKPKPLKSPEDKDSKDLSIPGIVATKKKRKPMSKSYPSNKWDEKDAQKALQTEKDFSKNLKNQSLIIKFPDPELTKDIVKKFNIAIENVHFPQASTPRYCFAHLEENADINAVAAELVKIPFGQGFLSVDIKKPREDNMEVTPKDIDPYTLYVGNLPINVTKQGVIQQYPGCTRIDIGHPQQMKNTRYAFVRFSNVDDAIKAYRSTRNTQYESRSLIVRFRRINGNVGVPGETKQQNLTATATSTKKEDTVLTAPIKKPPTLLNSPIVNNHQMMMMAPTTSAPDLSLVKNEPNSDNEDDIIDVKPIINHTNGVVPDGGVQVKTEIKHEPMETPDYNNHGVFVNNNEDEVEHEEEEEEYVQDNYPYVAAGLEDDFDYEDEEEYEEDDQGLELDPTDTFLPGDDDDF